MGRGPLAPGRELRVQLGGGARDIGAGHLKAAQLARDVGHASGRDARDVHLGDRELERPLAAQPALERLRVEAERLAARQRPDPRHAEREFGSRPQRLVLEAVRIARACFRPLARRRAQLSALGLNPRRLIYLNWNQFDDIDEMHLPDVSEFFEFLWYPGADDPDLFDESVTWILSISHDGDNKLAILQVPAPGSRSWRDQRLAPLSLDAASKARVTDRSSPRAARGGRSDRRRASPPPWRGGSTGGSRTPT